MTKRTHTQHRILAVIPVAIAVPLSYLLKMKVGYRVYFYLFPVFYLLLSSYGFTEEFSPIPQLHQKAPREISRGLIHNKNYQLGTVIPGLQQGAVPQGLSYSNKYNLIFISYYFDKHIPSVVSVIDKSNNTAIGTFALKESVSSFHYGHVGGLTVNDNFVWVSSNEKLYKYKISDTIKSAPSRVLVPISVTETETKASFVTYYQKVLFVGEFAYGSKYKTKNSHHTEDRNGLKHYAWVCGYNVNKERNGVKYILSIRQKVQGICITDKYIFLSISYGRRNRSIIAIYKNPLQEQPHRTVTLENGLKAPLWYLDGKNIIREIDFPPMSEGITIIDGKLAVLPESGAEKYQNGGLGPLDHIILIDLEEYL
ncbi:MAG: hypothetical protein JSV50_02295 [Desulfobacteraceae bacterium]|nr:MAG: hypothetical protein JSV50_02295 [Desulfobacteraceae bacterium]